MRSQGLICLALFFLAVSGSGFCNTEPSSPEPGYQAWVDACSDWDSWDKGGPAFRVFGNTYYVGTCGIAAILITSDQGHILIDSGTDKGADVVINNIKTLGFAPDDIKILLHSHEHFDHVGGLAKIQQLSGARLLASPAAALVLNTGIADEQDPQAGKLATFPAAKVDEIIEDGKVVKLGNLTLTAYATPGHSLGALSWQWQSCEGTECLNMVYADSMSAVSNEQYHFSEHLQYLADYRQAISKVAVLPCQILLTPHPSASDMRTRLSSVAGLLDAQACKNYAAGLASKLAKRLASEQLVMP
jgi:metallo-beta-lactamase class B